MSASFSSDVRTAQVNSSPGIGFAQEATDVVTDVASDVATDVAAAVPTEEEEEEEETAAEVGTKEQEGGEEAIATEVATEEQEETVAAEVSTEQEEEEEEETAHEVANSDEGKPCATKVTVVATKSPLPKNTAHIIVTLDCVTNTVNEINCGQLPLSIIPDNRDISNSHRVDCFFFMGTISSSLSYRPPRNSNL